MKPGISALLLCVLASGCESSGNIKLTFGADGQGTSSFACLTNNEVDPPETRLASRAFSSIGAPLPVSVTVDFLELSGNPSCRTFLLTDFCADADEFCRPMGSRRVCIEGFDFAGIDTVIDLPEDVSNLRRNVATRLREVLAARQITGNAPDRLVMLRMVASTQTCSEIAAAADLRFDELRLLGCAYSCPIDPDTATGALYLGFDVLNARCEPTVRGCASDTFNLPEL